MIKKIHTFVTKNKSSLGRQALVIAGTVIGGLIIDMAVRRPEVSQVVVIEEEVTVESSDDTESSEEIA